MQRRTPKPHVIFIFKSARSAAFVLRRSAACTKTAALLAESRTACIAHFANSRSHPWNCCSIYKSFGLRQQISFLIDFNQRVSQPAHQTCPSFDAGDIGAIYRPQSNAYRRRIHRVFAPLLHQRSRSEALSHFIHAPRPRSLSGLASRQKRPYGCKPPRLRRVRAESSLRPRSNERRPACCRTRSAPMAELERPAL